MDAVKCQDRAQMYTQSTELPPIEDEEIIKLSYNNIKQYTSNNKYLNDHKIKIDEK